MSQHTPAGQHSHRSRSSGEQPPPHEVPRPRMWVMRGLTAVLVAALVGLVPSAWGGFVDNPLETAVWLAALLIANGFAIPAFGRRGDVSLSAPVTVAVAVLFAPPFAAVINALGFWTLREVRGGTIPTMALFNRAQAGLSAGAASLLATQAPGGLLAGTLVAALAYTLLNTLFVAVAFVLRRGARPGHALRQAGAPSPRFALDFAITTLLALVVVIAYEPLSYGALVLLALPLWLGWSAMRSAQDAEDRAEELAGRVRELETLHDTARDLLTARTAQEAAAIGERALHRALDRSDITVSLAPPHSEEHRAIPVLGADPAAVLVPDDLDEQGAAVAESVTSMLGLALVRQRLEQELAEVQRARAELAAQILEEGVRERSRLAVELHDDVLPQLSGAQMAADNARSALEAGLVEQANRLATHAGDQVSAGISRVREVLDAIQRQIIVPGGLHDGLRAALDELKLKSGVDGHLEWSGDLPALPYAVEILLLETARGCFANVTNHASAETVHVALDADGSHVRMSVSDDGKGFEPEAVAEGHHGLALMRQRTELARGSFTVRSAPGRGTRIEVEVPR